MVGLQQSLTLNCEAEGNPPPSYTLGLHVTQNKFVTRTLWIFHNFLMMSTIPAEWSMYMEMIQKLPMFVSHINIVVMYMYLTAVSSYKTTNMIGFFELNQGLSLPGYKSPNSAFTLS